MRFLLPKSLGSGLEFFLTHLADGESLGDFAFRKAIRHLRCSDTDGVAFWVDMVGYSSALAYGVLIPLFLVPKLQEVSMKWNLLLSHYHSWLGIQRAPKRFKHMQILRQSWCKTRAFSLAFLGGSARISASLHLRLASWSDSILPISDYSRCPKHQLDMPDVSWCCIHICIYHI